MCILLLAQHKRRTPKKHGGLPILAKNKRTRENSLFDTSLKSTTPPACTCRGATHLGRTLLHRVVRVAGVDTLLAFGAHREDIPEHIVVHMAARLVQG
jgi:hypothetical protein